MFPLVGCEGPESVRLARTSQEGGNAPAIDTAGARYACPLPYLFLTLVIALTLTTSACAAFRATDPAGPRSEERRVGKEGGARGWQGRCTRSIETHADERRG